MVGWISFSPISIRTVAGNRSYCLLRGSQKRMNWFDRMLFTTPALAVAELISYVKPQTAADDDQGVCIVIRPIVSRLRDRKSRGYCHRGRLRRGREVRL